MSLLLCGIGTAVPYHAVTQRDAAGIAQTFCCETEEQAQTLAVVYRRTGIQKRHSVLLESDGPGTNERQSFYPAMQGPDDGGPSTGQRMECYEREAEPLAVEACRRAFHAAATKPGEITHLVTVSCSGFSAPGFDLAVLRELGLPGSVSRTHVGFMGCHGVLNGLRVARAFVEADARACVLLCAVELCTLHQQYGWQRGAIVANALFADGAAALIARRKGDRAAPGWSVTRQASLVLPDSADAMTWRVGDHGFQMTLSAQVPELIARHLRDWLAARLGEAGLSVSQVPSWAIHPGGPRVLAACAEALLLNPAQLAASQTVLAEFGNMSSPTVLFIMQRLQQQNARLPCVLLAFGPGLTIEMALVQ